MSQSPSAEAQSRARGRVKIELAGWQPIYAVETRRALATALLADRELAPHTWSDPTGRVTPLDRAAFAGEGLGKGPAPIRLLAPAPLQLSGALSMSDTPWIDLDADLGAVEGIGLARWLAWADGLTRAFAPDFGRVRVALSPAPGARDAVLAERWDLDAAFSPIADYALEGPRMFGASTYLGPRLTRAVTKQLAELPTGLVHDLGGGLVRVDVALHPLALEHLAWIESQDRMQQHFDALIRTSEGSFDWGGRARSAWNGPRLDHGRDAEQEPEAQAVSIGDLEQRARTHASVVDVSVENAEKEQAALGGLRATQVTFAWTVLPRADFRGAALQHCNLEGMAAKHARFDDSVIERCSFLGVDLSDARFEGARLTRVDLDSSDMPRACFERAQLEHVSLDGTQLEGASFRDAQLRAVRLSGADLRNADLRGATFHDGSLEEADLRGAKLEGLVLRDVRLDNVKLDPGVRELLEAPGA